MTLTTSPVGGLKNAALTTTASLLLSVMTSAAVQRTGPSSGPSSSGSVTADVSLKNKLVFPYGVQKFEQMNAGESVTKIPGWQLFGAPAALEALIAKDGAGFPRGGSQSRRWMCVEDHGASLGDGFFTPPIVAPDPWDYAWTFDVRVDAAPVGATYWPVLAIQHDGSTGFQDAWGVQITNTGTNLFVTNTWATFDFTPLYTFSGATGIGQWVHLRIVASLEDNRLEAFVNGVSAASLPMNPKPTTDVTRQRFAYHGEGPGNTATVLLDDVGVAFLSGVCKEDLNLDFTNEDDGVTALVNGQDISTPPEFGDECAISSAGPNNGAAIFDSSISGPNDPSQDLDLLVDQGNIMMLQQNDTALGSQQTVAGIFDRPNDDEDGGTLTFLMNRPMQPLTVDLIDIDDRPEETVTITLTDFSALTRTYTVPPDWTGDLTQGDPGVGTLDLTALAAQPGWMSVATAVEDLGYDPNAVVSIVFEIGGSGGVDNLNGCIPCVELDFEAEDDGTPDTAATPIVNGQDLSTPPEFGIETMLSSAGANAGAAAFDSTPGGPNFPGPDNDLLVGLGNILILQNNTAATQTVPGIFDVPNDDQDGGDITFDFPAPVTCHRLDLIDIDEEDNESGGATVLVVLYDSGGDTRTYSVPNGWTEKLTNDGPPAFRTLDMETLAAQPGFMGSATAVEDPGFDPTDVIQVVVTLFDAGAMDNFCFCP